MSEIVLQNPQNIDPIKFEISNVNVTAGSADRPYYRGAYTVNPSNTQQTLATKSKAMLNDVVVNAISYVEVPNAKGTTVIIGGVE